MQRGLDMGIKKGDKLRTATEIPKENATVSRGTRVTAREDEEGDEVTVGIDGTNKVFRSPTEHFVPQQDFE